MRSNPFDVACPTCSAPPHAPCADLRTYDRNLFGNRTHRDRRRVARDDRLRPLFVDVPLPFEDAP